MKNEATRNNSFGRLVAVLLVLAVAALTPAAAPAQVNTAVLEVGVNDTAGVALPGVTVRVIQVDTGFERVAVTGLEGGARIAALAPGGYTISFELSGFLPLEEAVVLRVGQTARVVATMSQARTEEITVLAVAPVVDVFKVDSSTNILPEQIESLPVADRDFQRLAFIAPGVQRERGDFRFIKGGPVVGAGGNASQATIMVDGLDLTDQALGLARARFSQDAIREFRVINNRFDTEIGGSAGGALSIVTRSGSNLPAGSVFAFYRADDLRARGALESEKLAYSRGQYGFTLGGPLVKDRTHYFLSAEHINEDNITLFRPRGAFTNLADDIERPVEQTLGFAGLDHSFSTSQRLSVRFVWERYREENFRVGGVSDLSNGLSLDRDNWNISLEHILIPSANTLNELRVQFGSRRYDEPTNSDRVEEWFSSGNTLRTGTNTVGHLLGDGDRFEVRNTFRLYSGRHEWKLGGGWQRVEERSRIDVFQNGLMLYLTDDRSLPLAYTYGVGSADVTTSTNLFSVFLQDDWKVLPNLTLSAGLRWDLDTDGNNPDFTHTMVPDGRDRDTDNFQPRLGFSWDVTNAGRHVVRGGWGRFAGRYLLVPAFTELQQNGETGRRILTRLNGLILGLPPAFWLDPNNPTTTGIPLPSSITLLDNTFDTPEADQATLGYTVRLGSSNLFLDTEAVWVKGRKEIVVGDKNFRVITNPATGLPVGVRPNAAYDQINVYTNDGRSEYKALVMSLSGTIRGGHLITTSVTVSDKKNISDDFSPEFPFGYPSDPTNLEGEYGFARGHERYRVVMTGIFKLPWAVTVAPIFEYGSGQPWNHRLGYDFNGDGKNSDRPEGVKRNSMSGPPFRQFSLRLTKGIRIGDGGRLDLIAEAFNLFNTTNYNVNAIDNAEFRSGPTLANPAAPYVVNPNFGNYSDTFPGREIQLGLRYSF